MSDQFLGTGWYTPLSPYGLGSVLSQTFFASANLLMSSMQKHAVAAAPAWRWLLWPVADLPDVSEPVNSKNVKFILSGERFPIDIIGAYDVDRAKAIILKAPRKSLPVDVDVWRAYADKMEWDHLNASKDPAVDCSIPAIIATVNEAGGSYMLIDGWHRIDKASAEGRNEIQAFYLTEDETKQIFDVAWRGMHASRSSTSRPGVIDLPKSDSQ